ncbi:hypothetical protein Nepgr_013927 [Nepenthes gracilis]|uniref:E3 ubiquitin-protein ligase RMA n=1 Tax=Nepenthes gracilis TaxID=150966 RepID=A0AAD3SKL8_NEPGR|nr:hypothetical protein Nepgr_013927 [Nepenthes gracilis]
MATHEHDDVEKRKSALVGAHGPKNNPSGSFDCNICLDVVQDPVVTFCGHLFCWPCIYKWIHLQSISPKNPNHQPLCPVCKAEVSVDALIPLYGGCQSMETKGPGLSVPQRPAGPPPCGVHDLADYTTVAGSHTTLQLQHQSYPHRTQSYYNHPGSYATSMPVGLAGPSTFHLSNSVFGGMILSWIFGNSPTRQYTYTNSYHLSGFGHVRARQWVMQMDRSLSRVSFFLFCCMILCLLFF